MKAAYIEQFGGPEVVKYGDLPDPSAGAGQIVVDAHAASVNGADWKVRVGHHGPQKFPLVLGRDFSGVVSAVGEGVTDLRVGDEVFGVLELGREGAYAEKVFIAASIVAKKPGGVSHVDAAALALTGLTALVSIEDTLKLKSGETILIQGGAGGVGELRDPARQASRRPRHHHRERGQPRLSARLGADQVIDYNATEFTKAVERRCGVRHRRRRRGDRSFAVLKPGGRAAFIASGDEGAGARARRRDGVAAGGRPRPAASRSRCRALPGRGHPSARGHALQVVRRRRSHAGERGASRQRQAGVQGAVSMSSLTGIRVERYSTINHSRRQFLRHVARGAALAALPQAAMRRTIRRARCAGCSAIPRAARPTSYPGMVTQPLSRAAWAAVCHRAASRGGHQPRDQIRRALGA